MINKDTSPTIEQSLKMIEEKLKTQKKFIMANKVISPTMEQSIKMIEEKIKTQKKGEKNNKSISEKTNVLKKGRAKDLSLSKLFKENKEEKIIKPKKKDNVLLLTKKIDDKGKIVDLKKDKISQKKLKVKSKNIVEKKQDEGIDLSIKDHKNLNKTIDLAVIIKKLKKIRDEELNSNKKKSSKKTNKEIIKLNQTIDLAEDLFKKELLDL